MTEPSWLVGGHENYLGRAEAPRQLQALWKGGSVMDDRKLRTTFEPGRGYSKEDWDDVSDNPEWTEADFRAARPFVEVFPLFAGEIGSQEPAAGNDDLNQTILVERRIVDKFREQGADWQQRINEILRKAVGH